MIDLDNVCEWCFTDKNLEVFKDGEHGIIICPSCIKMIENNELNQI